MRVEFDKRRDVAYFAVSTAHADRQVRLDGGRVIDYGSDGAVVGVEFLSPLSGMDLSDVPRALDIEREARRLGFVIRVPASAF